MKKNYVFISFTLLFVNLTQAQLAPSMNGKDVMGEVRMILQIHFNKLSDGGFIMVGSSGSNNGDVSGKSSK
jgi:hypothetical protein